RVLTNLRFALRRGGCLFLGSAETTARVTEHFEPISKKWRLYRAIGDGTPGGAPPRAHRPGPPLGAGREPSEEEVADRLLLERFTPAAVLVDDEHEILRFHGPTARFLTHRQGRPSRRLIDLAREGLETRLRSALRRAREQGSPAVALARLRREPGS